VRSQAAVFFACDAGLGYETATGCLCYTEEACVTQTEETSKQTLPGEEGVLLLLFTL
jgi:hypothetical protein